MGKKLIVTCGTSLIMKIEEIRNNKVRNKIFNDENETKKLRNKILNSLEFENIKDRKFGAEISSIYYLINSKRIKVDAVELLVTDSIEGKFATEIIKEILINKFKIKNVKINIVKFLNISKENEFAVKGLRELVRETIRIIRKENIQNLLMLPIGGFKAQISIVTIIAQIFKIPAYYLYEFSESIIELLPLPISLDENFFFENYLLLKKIEDKGGMVPKKKIEEYINGKKEVKNLLEEENIDGEKYIGLSPLGILGFEKLLLNTESSLPRNAKPEEKGGITVKKKEQHAKEVLEDFYVKSILDKILSTSYVKKIIVSYFKKSGKNGMISIKKSSNKIEKRVLYIEISIKKGILGANIFVTEQDENKLNSAIKDLYSRIFL